MRILIVAAATAAVMFSIAAASAGTGIGKGSPSTGPTTPGTTTANPCNSGDTYDATKNLCTDSKGNTYTPKPK